MERTKIYTLDDEPRLLRLRSMQLTQLGYEVTTQVDPIKGIQELEEGFLQDPKAWDLVMTDLDMPGLNGEELAIRVRQFAPQVPIAMVTARMTDELRQTLSHIIDGFIQKPPTLSDYRNGIAEALENAAKRRSP